MLSTGRDSVHTLPATFVTASSSLRPNIWSCRTTKLRIRCSSETLPSSTIQRIADKLRSLGVIEGSSRQASDSRNEEAGKIFVPLPELLPKYRVGHTLDPSWSTPEIPSQAFNANLPLSRFDDDGEDRKRMKEAASVPTVAELTLDSDELRRLQRIGIAERRMLKVGKAGITEGVVNGIHERWRQVEVVKISCEDLSKLNMKRTHDLLERKTGGLVVWRSGSRIALYRGANYEFPYFSSAIGSSSSTASSSGSSNDLISDGHREASLDDTSSSVSHSRPLPNSGMPSIVRGVGSPKKLRFELSGEAELAKEADRILEGLGPRFKDWWGYSPLPVDGDLLPAVIPGYRKPFRMLPYGIKSFLTNDEMTALRRLSAHLPFHFVLGRNGQLQGLAASIVKLWEKCEVVKIAVKRLESSNGKAMTEELKLLTGGSLLARNDEFIVLYRGKDFLPGAVSSAIDQRRKKWMRTRESIDCSTPVETTDSDPDSAVHNNADVVNFDQRNEGESNSPENGTNLPVSTTGKHEDEVEEKEILQESGSKKEGITEEERYMLRKIGLKMESFLLIGRRGVFAGTIENMHLHWKYRELVKLICKERNMQTVHKAARVLESESGGILVCIEKVSKGYAIIIYRGKNYSRPSCLRPSSLPNKRESMRQSKEAQRRKASKHGILKFERDANEMQHEAAAKHGILKLERDANEMQHEAKSGEEQSLPESQTSPPPEGETESRAETIPPAVRLTNRDKLLLRKRALTMKKRPVLSVGRSNVLGGVAKTIKQHFEKHPLAIVSIKGRARGTNVRELVAKLEAETGAVFVSQEPNKVILYRGWGAEEEEGQKTKGGTQLLPHRIVSEELIEAIRFECGCSNFNQI